MDPRSRTETQRLGPLCDQPLYPSPFDGDEESLEGIHCQRHEKPAVDTQPMVSLSINPCQTHRLRSGSFLRPVSYSSLTTFHLSSLLAFRLKANGSGCTLKPET